MTRLPPSLTVRSPHHRTPSRWAAVTTPEVARQHRQERRRKAIGRVLDIMAIIPLGCAGLFGAVLAAAFMLGVAGW